MALDVYQSCLGGMPKKIKHCPCAKDLLADLNKIVDALRGGQRAGALSLLNRQLELKGSRACLLTLKGTAQLQMQDFEGVTKTAEEFLQAHPDNPVACGLSAFAAAAHADRDVAVARLQQALAESSSEIHEIVYEAIGAVAQLLVQTGDLMAARAHLGLLVDMGSEDDSGPREMLMRLDGTREVPLLLKQDWELSPAPPDALWRDACQTALDSAQRGAWSEALQRFQALAEELPNEPTVWRNIAILAGYLAQSAVAADAWHRYAAQAGVDLDDAVEAEALAQLLSIAEHPSLPEISQTYAVLDTERVMERLLSEKHVDRIPGDLASMGSDESPPPKAAFWLLDRALPRSGEGLTFDQVPAVLGEMYLFGRETDREARLEFVTTKTPDLEAKMERVRQLLAEFGGELRQEEEVGEVPVSSAALSWRWRVPNDVTPAQRSTLIQDKRRDVNLNVWPDTPLPELDGKRPAEVAADPLYRVRILAAILLLELNAEQDNIDFDFNELRAKLGLPLREDLDPAILESRRVTLPCVHLLPAEKLSDDQLTSVYMLAMLYHAPRAVRRIGAEILRRPSLKDKLNQAEICHSLCAFARTSDDAVEWIQRAQQAAVQAKQSPARFLLQELELRRARNEPQECPPIFARLQTQHIREPGVAQALYAWLRQVGAIAPDGKPAMPAASADAPAAAPADAGIWTPDQPAAPAAGQTKSGIWLPGMD
ncbi:MAG: hypothetical protein GX575_18650 [Candidatus Anammoximicrobium sp.]|nr:hypothetical protein [Candidatus Anammoximicrobium sp.]